VFRVDGIDPQKTKVGLDLSDLGNGLSADGDLRILGYLVADEDNLDVRMVRIFHHDGYGAGNKCCFQGLRQGLGKLYQGGAAGGHHEHILVDKGDGLTGDQLFLRMRVYVRGRVVEVIERKGQCSSMHLDDLSIIRQLLQIPADSILRNVQVLAEIGGQHLVMQIDLV